MPANPACRVLAMLLLLAAALAPLHGHAAASYSVSLLPAAFNPSAINNAGQMAGTYDGDSGAVHAALYAHGVVTDLGAFGGSYSYASAINGSGAVAGTFATLDGPAHGFLYRDGAMVDLGEHTFGMGINNNGDVVGQRYTGSNYTAFLYHQGVLTDLGHLGSGDISSATAINDAGQVVGESNIGTDLHAPTHPFLYANGTMQDLGMLAGREISSAQAINNAGLIAGYSEGPTGAMHAFLYDHGAMADLGTFGGLDLYIGGLNNAGVLVGTGAAYDANDVPFIWRGSGPLVDLNTLLDPAQGWHITAALGINDVGQIIANGCHDTQCSAVLLNPASAVPEPASSALLAAGLCLVRAARRRQVWRQGGA